MFFFYLRMRKSVHTNDSNFHYYSDLLGAFWYDPKVLSRNILLLISFASDGFRLATIWVGLFKWMSLTQLCDAVRGVFSCAVPQSNHCRTTLPCLSVRCDRGFDTIYRLRYRNQEVSAHSASPWQWDIMCAFCKNSLLPHFSQSKC